MVFIMAEASIYYYIIRDVLAILWKYIFPHPCTCICAPYHQPLPAQPPPQPISISSTTRPQPRNYNQPIVPLTIISIGTTVIVRGTSALMIPRRARRADSCL